MLLLSFLEIDAPEGNGEISTENKAAEESDKINDDEMDVSEEDEDGEDYGEEEDEEIEDIEIEETPVPVTV